MLIDNCHIICNEEGIIVGRVNKEKSYYLGINHYNCTGASTGISINSKEPEKPKLTKFTIIGGEGLKLHGTGISIGVGSSCGNIAGIQIWEL